MSDRVDPRRILIGSIALRPPRRRRSWARKRPRGSARLPARRRHRPLRAYMPGGRRSITSRAASGTHRSTRRLSPSARARRSCWPGSCRLASDGDGPGAAAIAQAFAALIVFRWVPHRTQSNLLEPPRTSSNPFVSVFRTREAMDYIVGYAAHMWELFAMRSWLVLLLA